MDAPWLKMAVFGAASLSAVTFNAYFGIPAAIHGTATGLATGRNLTDMPPDAPELARICREMYGGHRDVYGWKVVADSANRVGLLKGSTLLLVFDGTEGAADFVDDVLVADPLVGGWDRWLKLQTGKGDDIDFTRKAFMEAAKFAKITHITITGHSLGGFRAWFVAKWASGDRFFESAGQLPEELRDLPISGHVFNPASALSNYFKVDAHRDRPESIMAHVIVGDLLCTGWTSASSEVRKYIRKPGYTLRSIENFCFFHM
ncbi:unnamed protein product [Symbiodinium sp. CCMP2592]|nr:unnamed protein product [Symbiodinium sp. CCMP2592]